MLPLAVFAATINHTPPTYYEDVLPIFQDHCQECHRAGEIAPFALTDYKAARPWAKSIKSAVIAKKMPPWFADPGYGHFSNGRSLTKAQIDTLAAWVDSGAPATGEVDYQYVVLPTGFTEDKWVQMAEMRTSRRAVVHIDGDNLSNEILTVFTPGLWRPGVGKRIPAGSDLVFQIHYTPNGKAVADQGNSGKAFEYRATFPDGPSETLLKGNPYDFQMIGFVDVEVPADMTLRQFFTKKKQAGD